MTFLEPLLLWGLPLALLPVIIHLFNRLRHRTLRWGAMMFLITATRKSTRYAKLRQFLILLLRCLAILGLIVAVSRPLAGGWLGWMLHAAPDVIVLVLDRSASMEARMPGGSASKREAAVKLFADTALTYEQSSRLVLFDTALRMPQDLGDARSLPQLSMTGPTDTAADIPATLQAVLDWLARNKPGNVEIWFASDLQRTSWQPESTRWTALAAQLTALPQHVRLRLLVLDQPPAGESAAITLLEVNRRHRRDPPELEVIANLERNNPAEATLPLTVSSDVSRALVEVPVQGQSFRYRHKVTLESPTAEGWGKMELPADDNPRDNAIYYVFSPPVTLRTAVVASDEEAARVLRLAAAPIPGDTNRVAETFAPDKLEGVTWSDYSLVLWCAALPKDTGKLDDYVQSGGSLLVFPSGTAGPWAGAAFGDVDAAEKDKFWKVERWDEKDGPLAKTEEGLSLPLNELAVTRRQAIGGEPGILATFEGGQAFLTRRTLGKGEILFCATAPMAEWSNLREGVVLVPLVQRLVAHGGRRFTQASLAECGGVLAADAVNGWVSLEGAKDYRTQAGVYRSGNRLIALNRPAAESDPETIEPGKSKALFGSAKVQLFAEQKQGESRLQSELWRAFLFAMLLFLLVEGVLILPPKDPVSGGMAAFQKAGGLRP